MVDNSQISEDFVDEGNSSTAILGISGTFTGTGQSTLGFSTVIVFIDSDVDSANAGVHVEFSSDNSNFDLDHQLHYKVANAGVAFQVPVQARFYRIRYVNGATGQANFRLQAILIRGGQGTTLYGHDYDLTALAPERVRAVQTDSEGRLTISTLSTSAAHVRGTIAHNDPDADEPVKIGGSATAALPVAVDEGDRVNTSHDLEGVLRIDIAKATAPVNVSSSGPVPHDDPDAGSPLKDGGRARATAIAAVAEDDRTDSIYSVTGAKTIAGSAAGVPTNIEVGTGGQVNIQGDLAHDAPDSGSPVKIGGIANVAAPTAVAENDRVNASFDLQGQLRTVGGSIGNIAGDVAHDSPDSGNPVKGGGRARATAIAAVIEDDRTDAIYSLTGGAMIAGAAAGVPTNIEVGTAGQVNVQGNVAHDAADAGNPLSLGAHAVEFNTDPPQVDADNDRTSLNATPQGALYTLGGHPNPISREYMTTGAQTTDPIIDSIAAGSQIVVLGVSVTLAAAGAATSVSVRLGFGAAAPPTEPTTGNEVDDMLLAHPGIAPGSGVVKGYAGGVVAVGGDGNELRIACDTPGASGQITVEVLYYISTL